MKRWQVAFITSLVLIIGVQFSVSSLLDAIDAGQLKRILADARSVATALDAHRDDHGKYPEAFGHDELASYLEPDYIKVLPSHVDYLSDGTGYVAYVWHYRVDGPMENTHSPVEVRDGVAVSWPIELGIESRSIKFVPQRDPNDQ